MAVIGGIISGVAAIMGGMAAANQANYQAQVAKNNQIIANRNAEYARVVGMREEEAYRQKSSREIATMQAMQAASGVDVTVGSPMEVRAGGRGIAELDSRTIRNNAQREAYGYKIESMNFEAQSKLHEMEADNAMMQGFLGGIGSIAGAFGSVSGKWSGWQSNTPYSPMTYNSPSPFTPSAPTRISYTPFTPAPKPGPYTGYIPGGY